jgi:hypothetical protein
MAHRKNKNSLSLREKNAFPFLDNCSDEDRRRQSGATPLKGNSKVTLTGHYLKIEPIDKTKKF